MKKIQGSRCLDFVMPSSYVEKPTSPLGPNPSDLAYTRTKSKASFVSIQLWYDFVNLELVMSTSSLIVIRFCVLRILYCSTLMFVFITIYSPYTLPPLQSVGSMLPNVRAVRIIPNDFKLPEHLIVSGNLHKTA